MFLVGEAVRSSGAGIRAGARRIDLCLRLASPCVCSLVRVRPSGSGSPAGVGGPAGSRRGDPGSGVGPAPWRPARCPAGGRILTRSTLCCLWQEKVERVGSGGDRADPGARANHPPHPPAPALLGMGGKCEGAGPRRPAAPSRRRSADPAQVRSRSTLSPTPGSVAQRLERTTHNREVPGSNPGGAMPVRLWNAVSRVGNG